MAHVYASPIRRASSTSSYLVIVSLSPRFTSIYLRWPRGRRALIPIMERNILLNKLQSNVTAAELDWCVDLCSNVRRGNLQTYAIYSFPGPNHYPNCHLRTLSSRLIVCTLNQRSRCLSPRYLRSYHLRRMHPKCYSATRSAEKPTNASFHCSKNLSRGPWYVTGLQKPNNYAH